jgi:hypothetical protein
MVFVTVHPEHVARAVLSRVDLVLAVGQAPAETLAEFGRVIKERPPPLPAPPARDDQIVAWQRRLGNKVFAMSVRPSRLERRRHIAKFVEGELSPANSFYFAGPEGKLHLRAQNFKIFLQLADGVDDATWMHHLRQGDYSRWIEAQTRDAEVAAAVAEIEKQTGSAPAESRASLKSVLEKHYRRGAAPSFPVPGTESADKR